MAMLFPAVLFLGLLIACSGGQSPAAPTATVAVDFSAVPAFTLNGCTPRSNELLGHGRCDPVNLIFPDARVGDVAAALVRAGWTIETLGTSQIVLAPSDSRELPQVVQLIDSDGTTVAPQRFHLRLWQLPDRLTIGAVHHELANIGHEIDRDWEAAEGRVRENLCGAGAACEEGEVIQEQLTQQRGTDRWRGFVNDGRPSIIRLPSGD